MNIDITKVKKLQKFSKTLNVLYVEDNLEARSTTTETLGEFFTNIDTAIDGLDGLNKFNSKEFDLIISDINMPNMNGIEMVRNIRKVNQDIPIIIISAHSDSNYFIETIKLGIDGYILKPIEIKQLLSLLMKIIDKLKLQKDLENYKNDLEQKVKEQLSEITTKDIYIQNREKYAAMGEMVDAIAHQFRQPLSIIKLQAQEIEYFTNHENNHKEEIEFSVNGIINQVNHAAETINEFRDFFRTNSDLHKVPVKSLFDSVLTLIKDELIQHTITIKIEGDVSKNINIIPNEFKHVLLNLINNAKDVFVEKKIENGTITLSVSINNDNKNTYISVQDNGGGIPPDIINKVFEANFTTKGQNKGTGIGLHISQMILKKINAKLDVENTNIGAKFTITIPTQN